MIKHGAKIINKITLLINRPSSKIILTISPHITDYALQITDYSSWITDYGLEMRDYRF